MSIRLPVDASQNVQAAFRDVEQELETLKAAVAAMAGGTDLTSINERIDRIQPPPQLDSDKFTFVGSGSQHSVGLVPDPGTSGGDNSRVLGESGGWVYQNVQKLNDEDQSGAGVTDIYTVPGGLVVAGAAQIGEVTTAQLNAWSHPGLEEAHGGVIINVNGILATVNVIAWQAPYACKVVSVRGYRVGGTSCSINARLNGSSNHLASALSLTSTDTWMDGGAVQNVSYAALDKLEIMITAIAGSPTQIGIQVAFRRT